MINTSAIYTELVAESKDLEGYITYVFKVLDKNIIDRELLSYIMCVQYPNWNQEKILIGDIGFLNIKEVQAGKDTWFDGNNQIFYKYDDIIFMKFVKQPSLPNDKIIL